MLLTRLGLELAEGPIYQAGAKLIGMRMMPRNAAERRRC